MHDAAPSGANRRRLELLKRLAGREFANVIDKIVIVTSPGVAIPESPESVVQEFIKIPGGAAGRFVYETRALKNVIERHSCNLLFQEAFPVPRITSIPILLTIHDLRDLSPAARDAGVSQRMAASSVIRNGVRRAAGIAAVSNFTKNEIVKFANADPAKVHLIFNAADHIEPPAAKALRSSSAILYVGHLEPRKRPDLLLEAFQWIQKEIPRSTLQFYGRGPLEKRLRARSIQLGLGGFVSFHANCNDRELSEMYQTAAAVAFPSKYEGFGIPLLEAMRFGAPVVASNSSAIPEITGAAALLVNSDDAHAWADAIISILNDTNLARDYSLRGGAREKKYSWAASARALVSLAESMTTKTKL
ncbi:MAG: glycosyltransferase family 4 protein [Planctomycetota bacterium]